MIFASLKLGNTRNVALNPAMDDFIIGDYDFSPVSEKNKKKEKKKGFKAKKLLPGMKKAEKRL